MVKWLLKTRAAQLFAADTIAMVLFGICAGTITIVIELFVVGLSLNQWAGIRLLYNLIRIGAARLCGKLTDRIRQKVVGESKSWIRTAVADTIALCLYQLPIYAASAFIMGATIGQVSAAAVLHIAETAACGWLYGVILNYVRKHAVIRQMPDHIKQ